MESYAARTDAAVMGEGKHVTYKWLARELGVSANLAKRLLFQRAEAGGCDVTHLVCGWRGAGAERVRVVRLDIVGVRADIADMREGEADHLPGEGRIGQHLLVPGHRGVEAHFADRLALGAEPAPPDHVAIGKHEHAGRAGGLCRRHGCRLGVGHQAGHSLYVDDVAKWCPLRPACRSVNLLNLGSTRYRVRLSRTA